MMIMMIMIQATEIVKGEGLLNDDDDDNDEFNDDNNNNNDSDDNDSGHADC